METDIFVVHVGVDCIPLVSSISVIRAEYYNLIVYIHNQKLATKSTANSVEDNEANVFIAIVAEVISATTGHIADNGFI